jgi:16S rRNA (guanine(966)-N(2))-methyltransferase RsmD
MRVIGGTAKGRLLRAVPGDSTRPILDRVKVPLFDILRPRLVGCRFLDLFGGTGSVGIEALSQGAQSCVFLDTNTRAIATIKENLSTTELSAQAEVRHTDAFVYLRNCAKSFDIIFVAPPQYRGVWIEAMRTIAERPHILPPTGQVIVQIDPKEYEPLELSSLYEQQQRRYGNSLLLFWELRGERVKRDEDPRIHAK